MCFKTFKKNRKTFTMVLWGLAVFVILRIVAHYNNIFYHGMEEKFDIILAGFVFLLFYSRERINKNWQNDIEDYRISEEKLKKVLENSKIYAENIVDTIREPLVVLDSDLKVVSANWYFYYSFRFLKENTIGNPFFDIYDHFWNIPDLKNKLENVVSHNVHFRDFEVSHTFPGDVRRIMIFSARQIYQTGQDRPRILLAIKDITEQKNSEDAMIASEKKYRYLFDNASDAIVTIDTEDKITSWNKCAEKMFGWKQEEALGQEFPELTVPSDLKRDRRGIIKNVLSGKSLSGIEVVRVKKDGGRINVSLTLSPVINEEKKIIGLSAIIRDITARKQEEKKLKLHARKLERLTNDLEKFKLAADNVSEQIVIADKNGFVLYANKGAEEITGYAKRSMMNKKAGGKTLWGGQMDDKFYQDFWKTIKEDKKIFIGEVSNKRKSGEKYIAEIRVSPILDAAGNIVFFVGVERDITKVKEIDRAKTEFVSTASHELRTPLANMSLSLEMLLGGIEGDINKEQRKYLLEVYQDIRGMSALIDLLLNVSRIELRTLTIEPEPTDLGEISDLVLKEFIPRINKKNLAVKTYYDDLLGPIEVDRNLMRIILQNLFSNAIKYTPSGRLIGVEITKKRKSAIIKVSDEGCGIPLDEQQKIFSKMFRAKNAIDSKNEGVGLGLYIVKSIVEQFGGRIWFESAEDQGTDFYVSIPLEGMKKQVSV